MANGCDSIRHLALEVLPSSDPECQTTSILNSNIITGDQAFPNPTEGFLYFKNGSSFEYELFDFEGKLLQKGRDNQVDMSTLPDGIYLLQYRKGEQEFLQHIVKQ